MIPHVEGGGKPRPYISRRQLLRLGLLVSGGIAITGISCKPKKETTDPGNKVVTKSTNKHKQRKKKDPVRKFSPDKFWLHTKNKILHYPVIYSSRENFSDKNFTSIPIEGWEARLDNNEARFSRERSAVIFEHFALKGLSVNDVASLSNATSVAARAFAPDYHKANQYSWRNYELLMKLITLNTSVSPDNKWQVFSDAIKNVETSNMKMPKRLMWIKSKAEFDAKSNFLAGKRDDYIKKLSNRIT